MGYPAQGTRILEKAVHFAAIGLAVLFIGLSLAGIFSAWFVSRKASDVALKGFGVIEIGVGVVDAGVGRVDDLIPTSRTEVRQAAETISTVGAQAVSNSSVLNALNERLETSLAPRIAQMRENLSPVRDAIAKVDNAVSFMSSMPMMAERAPRLATLNESFDRLEELSADATQLRGTLRELVTKQNNDPAPETVATLKGLAERINKRLGEVHAKVQSIRGDVDALKVRLEKKKSRLLFVFSLMAAASTLMMAWVVYTQVIVIQHHWTRMRPNRVDS